MSRNLAQSLPHLPSMTAGQSLSSLQCPSSPSEVSQSPRPPVLPTLSWQLTWEAAQERREIERVVIIDMITTQQLRTERGGGLPGRKYYIGWNVSGLTMCWKETNQLSETTFNNKGLNGGEGDRRTKELK